MRQQTESYKIDNQTFKGHWAFPEGEPYKRPAILVAHAWMGQDHFARHKAEELAKLGYIAFAADVYGEGKTASSGEEAKNLMLPLFQDRALLQKRILGAFEVVKNHPDVDPNNIGGIGFCFGGMTILELFKSGVDLKGVVTFHAVLGTQMGEFKAKTIPIAKGIKGSLLVLHGQEDPLVSQEDIQNFQKSFTEANVDWQMNIYSHTSHAFMNPEAHDIKGGLVYQPRTCERAWWAMIHFFSERFGLERKLQDY